MRVTYVTYAPRLVTASSLLIDVQKFFLSTKGHSRSTFAAARYIGLFVGDKSVCRAEKSANGTSVTAESLRKS